MLENHSFLFLRKTHDIIPSISILQTEWATCKLVNNYGWLRIIFNNWMSFHTWIIIGQLRSSIIRQLKSSITQQMDRNKVRVEKSILKGQISLKIDLEVRREPKILFRLNMYRVRLSLTNYLQVIGWTSTVGNARALTKLTVIPHELPKIIFYYIKF